MDFEVYCDESRQELFRGSCRVDGYVLIGGIWIKAEDRAVHKQAINQVRTLHAVRSELKWNKVSKNKLDAYRQLIEIFFSSDMRFRVIVLKASELDSVKFHQADDELMFYKFYYQLLHHWILDFNSYHIFVDEKTNRQRNRLAVLLECLANANITSVIHDVQALPSKEVQLIQLADVLIGAVGYKYHGLVSSDSKLELIKDIEKRLLRPIGPTGKAEEKFNVFEFKPGGGW